MYVRRKYAESYFGSRSSVRTDPLWIPNACLAQQMRIRSGVSG